MALENKGLEMKESKLKRDNGLDGLQKDPIELSNLIFSFQNALAASDRKKAKEILGRINDMIDAQFGFEKDVLYPRIRGLTSGMIEELSKEQRLINKFLNEASRIAHKGRASKARLFALSGIIPVVTNHLRDCGDLIMLYDKFGKKK